ncbi:MobF family relaxase [Streptomyces roseifaciens]
MLSVAKIQRRNAWRYYLRGVVVGDGRRAARTSMKVTQEQAGLPPGVWRGRGLAALGLTVGSVVTERQAELLFGEARHPSADRIERALLDDGADAATARRATALGQPVEEIEKRRQTPLLAFDFVFRPQASLTVLWALGDGHTRRVIEQAHERAIQTVLRWLEDEVAETRWSSGRERAKAPALVVAAFRHFDNRDGFPPPHDHCLILNRAQRPDGSWYALDTRRLLQHVVAAGTLYTLTMTTEVCEELGLATVPREVTPGLRPVMEIAGVGQELIDWSATRREQIEQALEGITDRYVRDHGRLPGERARHGLGWWAAQGTRREKKTPRPLEQLRAWWRTSAILRFGEQMVDGLLERCRAAGAAIRDRVGPLVDTALAAVDVAAVVFTVRRAFARRHVLAEARQHLAETLRGRAFPPGLDDYNADRALTRHSRQLTVPPARPPGPGARSTHLHRRLPLARPLVDRRHRRQSAPGVDPVRAGPGRQPRPAERDPRRPHRTRSYAGRCPRRARVGHRARRQPQPRPRGGRAARRRPPGPGRGPHPGAAGCRRPRPPAGRDARTAGRPYDRPGDVDAHPRNLQPVRLLEA